LITMKLLLASIQTDICAGAWRIHSLRTTEMLLKRRLTLSAFPLSQRSKALRTNIDMMLILFRVTRKLAVSEEQACQSQGRTERDLVGIRFLSEALPS
jgi:hypothetical protein